VAGPRDMGMEGPSRVNFGQETQGISYGAHGNAGRTSEEGSNIFIEALRRQLECRACDKRIRGVQQVHDERTLSLEEGVLCETLTRVPYIASTTLGSYIHSLTVM
jgi:hypothetical protein